MSFRLPKNRPPVHPGEMLSKEFLEPLNISQSEFARRLGLSAPRAINELVNGKRAVSAEMAVKLDRAVGMGADFWLTLQTRWDLWHALKKMDKGKLRAIEPLSKAAA